MKHNLFLTMLAAALLGSGVANAAGTLYASEYTKYDITLGTGLSYDTLVVNTTLALTGSDGYLELCNGATIAFSKVNGAEEIYSIFTPVDRITIFPNVYFHKVNDVYNITFDDDAQTVVAASAGTPIMLIQDQEMVSAGFKFNNTTPADTTLKLNGAVAGETVNMNGVQFKYVGPQSDTYTFKEGEIGFKGYYDGSYNLSLVANAPAVPEPTTGSLSLLALAGLCIRRRK